MNSDPRAALDRLIAAFEAHHNAAAARRGEDDPAVESAYVTLADAFELYDEALYAAYGEATPLVLYDDVQDELEELAFDESDDEDDDMSEDDVDEDEVDVDEDDVDEDVSDVDETDTK